MRVLLCDDNELQLEMLAEYLMADGFFVRSFLCPDRALAALCPKSLDAVVTDYHLRERSGCEIVRAATTIGLPSVVLTGSANIEEIARSVNVGARFVLLKPYRAEDVAERIREAVRENSIAGRIDWIIRKTGGSD